jgi:putative tricarboxylic transport membrane protein
MAVGVFFVWGGVELNFGTLSNPGPGFLPLIVALMLVFSGLLTLAKGLIRSVKPVSGISWRQQALITASVLFYGLLLDFFGFLISTFILMFILFGLLIKSKSKWYRVFLYAASTALVSWLVFSVALKVPFPSPSLTTIWR